MNIATKITNRPVITAPERRCFCGDSYRYPWSWAVLLPGPRIVDLCARCTRRIRYGTEEERRAVVATITTRYNSERRAAA